MLASGTEIVTTLDCGELLAGRSHDCDYPAWVRAVPAVTRPGRDAGGVPPDVDGPVRARVEGGLSVHDVDAEALARLRPDLVITRLPADAPPASRRDLEAALCAVVPSRPRLLALAPNALADLWRDMRAVADALGVPERGVQLVSRLVRRTRAIAERAAARPRARVACLEWIEPLVPAGGWTPELLALAGAADALAGPGGPAGPVTLKSLAAADPDAVIVAPRGWDLARTRTEMAALERRPGWAALRAVREGRVFLADGRRCFHHAGPRAVEALEVLAEALHPGAFRFGHEGRVWERRRIPAAGAAGLRPANGARAAR